MIELLNYNKSRKKWENLFKPPGAVLFRRTLVTSAPRRMWSSDGDENDHTQNFTERMAEQSIHALEQKVEKSERRVKELENSLLEETEHVAQLQGKIREFESALTRERQARIVYHQLYDSMKREMRKLKPGVEHKDEGCMLKDGLWTVKQKLMFIAEARHSDARKNEENRRAVAKALEEADKRKHECERRVGLMLATNMKPKRRLETYFSN